LYCTAHGKALLADCDDQLSRDCAEIRMQGFATDDREYQEWIRCIAAPICAVGGAIIGSIGVAAPLQHLTKDRYRVYGEQVSAVAQQITNLLGPQSPASAGTGNGSVFAEDPGPSERLAGSGAADKLHPVNA
jgi:DNA-binding IclR family transcriptional regulator